MLLTTSPPRRATWVAEAASSLAWPAALSLSRTACVIWLIDEAVSWRFAAACSVRLLRSWLPVATSALACWIWSAEVRTRSTSTRSSRCMSCRAASSCAGSSLPSTVHSPLRLPVAMRLATPMAALSGTQTERSVSHISGRNSASVAATSARRISDARVALAATSARVASSRAACAATSASVFFCSAARVSSALPAYASATDASIFASCSCCAIGAMIVA